MGAAAPFLPAVSIGASILGGVLGAGAQSQQANAQAGMYNYQAQVARNNQIIAQRNAQIAREQGEVAAEQIYQRSGLIRGSQRAALAAQGGDVNSGSPVDIVADTTRAGESDVATTRYNAALKAWGFENEAAGAGAQAQGLQMAASNTMASLPFGIGSSLLGGLGGAAGKWYSYMRAGTGLSPVGDVGPGTGYTY